MISIVPSRQRLAEEKTYGVMEIKSGAFKGVGVRAIKGLSKFIKSGVEVVMSAREDYGSFIPRLPSDSRHVVSIDAASGERPPSSSPLVTL